MFTESPYIFNAISVKYRAVYTVTSHLQLHEGVSFADTILYSKIMEELKDF